MFEGTRSDLVKRLGVLVKRFEVIAKRANAIRNSGALAIRAGLGGSTEMYHEIAVKARNEAALCAQSITLLARDRSFPLMFRKGVKKAEAFASQCEYVLDQADAGAVAGRVAFRESIEIAD